MSAEAILTVSAATVALVQIVKWSGLPDRWGPVAVMVLAAIGVAAWAFSQSVLPNREAIWPLFSGWINVALAAAGVFGFSRAAVTAVTRATPPPQSGAGSERTVS
jgi:hypothetical protein